jgi:hypothetical protein
MFITWRTYTATAGFSAQLEYVCALCHARATASVETQGVGTTTAVYGLGADHDHAARVAEMHARTSAIRLLQHAPCPRCGAYQPAVTIPVAAQTERLAKKKRIALPIALALAALVLVAGAYPAVTDLRWSSALLVAVSALAVAAFGLAYGITAWPPARPAWPFGATYFWWGRPDGSVGWVPPPPVPPPAVALPSAVPGAAVMVGILSALISVGGFIGWSATFEDVFLVEDAPSDVRLDGAVLSEGAFRTRGLDPGVRRFQVRSGARHLVEVAGASHELEAGAGRGWVIAPDAQARDVCFAEIETIYGKSPAEPAFTLLEPVNDMLVLVRAYDDRFQPSPKAQKVKSGQTVRRLAIRTASCDEP